MYLLSGFLWAEGNEAKYLEQVLLQTLNTRH